MDTLEKQKRSDIMRRIKGSNTKIEIVVRKWLFAFGYRYRINDKRYPGRPDIVLPRYKTMIFVHGCFWHGHSCSIGHVPKSNTQYWQPKIQRNKDRDEASAEKLQDMGWNVIVVRECELKSDPELRLIRLLSEICGEDYTYFPK